MKTKKCEECKKLFGTSTDAIFCSDFCEKDRPLRIKRESSRKYKRLNPEPGRKASKLWRKNNPEKVKEYTRKAKEKRQLEKDKSMKNDEQQSPIPEMIYIGEDDWGNDLYQTEDIIHGTINGKKRTYAMVDNSLHYITPDGEPVSSVEFSYKIKD